MNRRLTACCAVLVLLAAGCAETVRGSAAGASNSAALPTVAGSPGSSDAGSSDAGSSGAGSSGAGSIGGDGVTSAAASSAPESSTTDSSSTESSTAESSSAESSSAESSSAESSTAESSESESSESESAATTEDVDWQLPDPKPDPPRNSFGDVAAKPAQSYGVTVGASDDAPQALVFRVRKLVVDPTCADGSTKPRNGHFVLIDLQVEPRGFGDEQADAWYGTFTSHGWVAFDSEGGAQTGIDSDEADECLPDKRFPSLSDDELADADGLISGVVVLDVTDPTGTVLLDLQTGQKWEFGYSS